MKFIRKGMCFLLAMLAICTLLNTQSVFASEETKNPMETVSEETIQTQEETVDTGETQPEEGSDPTVPQIGDVITEDAPAYLVSGRARTIVDAVQVKKYVYVGETWYGLFWKNGNTWQQWGGDDWWLQTIGYYPFQSGKIGYCLEPYNSNAAIGTNRYPTTWRDIPVKWASAGGTFETEKQIGVSLTMAYGAPNNGDTSESGYYATATMIWDMCCGYRNVDGSYRFSNKTSPFYAAIKNALQYTNPTLWSEVDAKYNELLVCLANHGKVPSFSAKLSNQITDANTITLQYDVASGLYKASVTDTNQVLKYFNYVSTIDGLSFSKSGNTLNISATAVAAASLSTGTVFNNRGHEITIGPDSVVLWGTGDGEGQIMVTMDVAADPVPSYFKLKADIAGKVEIFKTTNTGENLGGWKFGVYSDAACTKAVEGSPFTSSANGTIITGDLLPGTYWVKEIDESDTNPEWDYDEDIKEIAVSPGETASVSFSNTHFGYAQIYKTTNTGKDLGGWKFNIYSDSACKNLVAGSPFVTDNTGLAVARLLPGTYYIREDDESSEHPDWVYDTQVHQVTVVAGQKASIRMENQQMGRANLIKTTPDGGPVSGWIFDIYRASDNAHMGTYTSGADGTIISDYMLPGEYIVQEQVDENGVYWCESENPQKIIIKAGETTEVIFVNRLKPGEIRIQKVDNTGEPLAGAEFLLEWSVDGSNWQPVYHTDSNYVLEGGCTSAGLTDGKLVSGEDGMVVFTGLHPERLYRLTETAAPEGYQLLTDTAYEGGLPADTELTVQLTVVNVRTFELPKTGSKSMLLMPISMALAAALCGAILVIGKRKER